ncbi:MAG: 1-(5-phosphoribosyl)-5-[(5-phosphoribosylamino)methylideneamino]imidazole-4-carboxamide isomerase [Bacteroidaceae bacterium]|nr:1-(5-phosphoribosyl)-5-[(5-phosphoribosylamino)methylideneamino]imidazole-4-carboxamide isomerase [Bacteroidaceae bacterium]
MSIELIPAIDIIDGNVVRLTQGDYAQKTVYGTSPADVAQRFEQMGFHRLHVVDLDGAKSHHVVNVPALKEITTKTNLVVDFGGGIKTDDDIKQAFAAGAAMVTVGSIAVQQPSLFERWLQTYGQDRMILGADVRNGRISINGWLEDSEEELIPFLRRYVDMGVHNVLCTDISRDGMLNGPAAELYRSVMQTFPQLNLIASGGVSSNADIEALHHAGIPAVVFGKAFYTGKLNIEQLWHLQNE